MCLPYTTKYRENLPLAFHFVSGRKIEGGREIEGIRVSISKLLKKAIEAYGRQNCSKSIIGNPGTLPQNECCWELQ